MKLKKLLFFNLLIISTLIAQPQFRNKINIPNILGYKTLKCDFHMHTVFSDGDVWPTYRVEEAWRDGLDAIAFTDHLEYQPHKDYIPSNFNAAYNIAKNFADELGLTLIKGAEITRKMPPGHLNAIFIKDGNELIKDDWKAVVEEVKKQGGIIFWNHPSWISQQPDGIAKWYKEHDWLLQTGILFGLEVYNANVYSKETHQWCIDKKLAVLGNSDVHGPLYFEWAAENVAHRPITLVFAKDSREESIKEALLNRRTVIWYNHQLIGSEKFLKALFDSSISINKKSINAIGRETKNFQITNNSDVEFDLKLITDIPNIQFPKEIKILPNKILNLQIRTTKDDLKIKDKIEVKYLVKNMLTEPDKNLIISFPFEIEIEPKLR
ncbi:MAG: Sb-PDE family phosphodiesterase [Melioribacteraceae bacterium]|nr:Sb-PDE family phosphodiesterase [Melioribacteraceae bacterium]